jgi:hypothetical protein
VRLPGPRHGPALLRPTLGAGACGLTSCTPMGMTGTLCRFYNNMRFYRNAYVPSNWRYVVLGFVSGPRRGSCTRSPIPATPLPRLCGAAGFGAIPTSLSSLSLSPPPPSSLPPAPISQVSVVTALQYLSQKSKYDSAVKYFKKVGSCGGVGVVGSMPSASQALPDVQLDLASGVGRSSARVPLGPPPLA